jgi:hypothetical protein
MDGCVKQLIDTCTPGGGCSLAPGAVLDHAEAANVHAHLNAGREYGVIGKTKIDPRITRIVTKRLRAPSC